MSTLDNAMLEFWRAAERDRRILLGLIVFVIALLVITAVAA